MKVKYKGKTELFVLTHDKIYEVIAVEKRLVQNYR